MEAVGEQIEKVNVNKQADQIEQDWMAGDFSHESVKSNKQKQQDSEMQVMIVPETEKKTMKIGVQSKKHLDEWQEHVKDKFVRIYEAATYAGDDLEMHQETVKTESLIFEKSEKAKQSDDGDSLVQGIELNQQCERFLTCMKASEIRANFGNQQSAKTGIVKNKAKSKETNAGKSEFGGCYIVNFKQIRQVSHVVTFQARQPLKTTY